MITAIIIDIIAGDNRKKLKEPRNSPASADGSCLSCSFVIGRRERPVAARGGAGL
jgi:hypothetical protein